jgi:hypothetical protein
MRKTIHADEAAEKRSADVVTPGAPPDAGPGVPFIGGLLRLARLRSRVAGKEAGEVVPPRRRADQDLDAARSSMDAGLTRGASLLFGEFGSRR